MKKMIIYPLLLIVLLIAILGINLLTFNRTASKISEGLPIPAYGTDNPALLVVDLQEATTGSASRIDSYIEQADTLIHKINELTVMTHQARIPVIFIVNVVTNPLVNLLNSAMAEGSEGARLDRRVVLVSDYVVAKTRNDAFSNPDLDRLLSEMKVNHLYLTGLDASYCVNCTLQGGLGRGYRVSVIEDAVIAAPREQRAVMMQQFRERGAEIIGSEGYAQALQFR